MPNALQPPRERAEGPSDINSRSEFRKRCTVCGQSFDTRDQDQVFHHDAKAHEPLSMNDQ